MKYKNLPNLQPSKMLNYIIVCQLYQRSPYIIQCVILVVRSYQSYSIEGGKVVLIFDVIPERETLRVIRDERDRR